MSKIVTIFGGAGFVGRYIAQRLAQDGWSVRVASRTASVAPTSDMAGQITAVKGNILNDASVKDALQGAEAVVNCVGTFDAGGANNFNAVQHEGAARIARLAASTGVQRMVHLSAIGADLSGTSIYAKTKGQGEVTVRKHMPEAVILRPSVVFGPEDQFFNRFAAMSRFNPVLPISGGETKFQPVYVDDVAQAAVAGVVGTAEAGIYELGGPDVESFRALMQRMLDVLDRSRVIFDMPSPLAGLMAFGFDTLETVTGRLFKNTLLTRDQLKSLAFDNVVTGERGTFEDLGIAPRAMADILPLYVGVPAEQVDPRAIAQTAAQDG